MTDKVHPAVIEKLGEKDGHIFAGMEMLYFRVFCLILLSVLSVISQQARNLQTSCPVFAGDSLFVNSTSGKNTVTCGAKEGPCLTISYAVDRAVERNITSVIISISTGVYKEADSIKLDCSRWHLRRITLRGERQDKQVVKVDFSLHIQFCQMSLVNLHWTSGNPVLHNVLLSNISICNCTAQGTYVSVIGSSSNILLLNSVISNSSGYHQGLPLISLTSLPAHQNTLQIEHCNFSHNVGPLVFIGNAYQASIINSHLEDNNAQSERNVITSLFSHLNISSTRFVQNFGTLVGVQNSGSVNVSDCLFQRNEVLAGSIILMEGMTTAGVKDCAFQNSRSSTKGSVLKILDSYSSASFKRCHFSCNMVKSSAFLPPVVSDGVHQVSCDNCTVDQSCPVHCSPGEFLDSSILCKPCPIGSYSPGIVMNKTVLHCASCPAGTYSSKTKSKMCTPCAEGTFSSKTGSTLCSKCKNDYFTSKPGQASCSKLTVEFITLIILVSVLTAVPLLILLLQRKRSVHEGCCSPCIVNDETSPLLRKRKRKRPNYSIQRDDVDGNSLPGMSA